MPPTPLDPSFPLHITLLLYTATGALLLILFLLFLIHSKFYALSAKLTRSSRSAKNEEQDAFPNVVEAPSSTHFEEFLNEHSDRRRLTKKEQFKAYRAWRSEKGLNWTK
jgi:hypothetical protein